jgi:hypothetical protein
MSYNVQIEYAKYQQNLMDLVRQMPGSDEMSLNGCDNSIARCQKIINDFLASKGLEIYIKTKPLKTSEVIEITDPSSRNASHVNITVKNSNWAKLLQDPLTVNRFPFL